MAKKTSETASEEFLKDYINCIADAGRQLHSREWWATDIASKNRFTSRLVRLLTDEVRADDPFVGIITIRIYQAGRIVLSAMCTYWHHLQAKWVFRKKTAALLRGTGNPRYVIKTFVFEHSFAPDGTYRDTFFGRLPQRLKAYGRSVLVYAVILGDRKKCLRLMVNCPDTDIIPAELFCSGWKVLADALHLLFFRFRPLGSVLFHGKNVASLISGELSRTLNDIPPFQFFHYRLVAALVKKIRIETFLQTGENNPWERMCILALRKYAPSVRILSYQHATVPQASANMFAGSGEAKGAPLPDRLLTTGAEPKRIIEKYGEFPEDFVTASCGWRYEYLEGSELSNVRIEKASRRILLALDGNLEGYRMLEYVLRELAGHSEYVLKARTHPVLPFDKICRRLSPSLPGLEDVELSTERDLKKDLWGVDAVIYWGSTVGLEALKLGLPVIHFDMGTKLSYDPLFAFDCKIKRTVTENESLIEILKSIFSLEERQFLEAQNTARKYLDAYFSPVSEDNFKLFL